LAGSGEQPMHPERLGPAELGVEEAISRFIPDTRGGCAFLPAGGLVAFAAVVEILRRYERSRTIRSPSSK
jgi:hypothetical protein